MILTHAIAQVEDLIQDAQFNLERKGGIVLSPSDIEALQTVLQIAKTYVEPNRRGVCINTQLVEAMLGRPVDWEKASWTKEERGEPEDPDPEPFI